jgi:hypothetical protein
MYSKEQAAKQRQKFWTAFGQYMKPVPGAGGDAVNWINYKTGIRHIVFRMDANKQQASIAIELRHAREEERQRYFEQFLALKSLLENTTGYKWNWQADAKDEHGQTISRISQVIENVNVLNEGDWPLIISFLKPRIMSLDAFWELVKDGFG